MHKRVQYEIAEEYGYGIEVYVTGPKGVGFLDIYDASQNEYYEVKHQPAAVGPKFDAQMEKYDDAHVAGWRFEEYQIDGDLARGDTPISGRTQYQYWDIYYWLADDGVVVYIWELNENRYKHHLAKIATVGAAVFTGFALGIRGGAPQGKTFLTFDLR